MHVTTISGVGEEGGAHPESCTDQTVMDRRDREEHRKGGLVGLGSAVGQAENGAPLADGGRSLVTNFSEALLECFNTT